MKLTRFASVSVLVLKADRIYAETLQRKISSALPHAHIETASTLEDGVAALARQSFDLLVTGLGGSVNGDVLEFIGSCNRTTVRHVFVVSPRPEQRFLSALRGLNISGVFDSAHDDPAHLSNAIRTILRGGTYWSENLEYALSSSIEAIDPFSRRLTMAEQIVLSIIGDGCDDCAAATFLGLRPSTVSTVRRKLHRKLGIQHRGELVRVAAQNGYVRFTPTGVVRPGFALLTAAYEARRTKRPARQEAA